jgi:hypothetical protein
VTALLPPVRKLRGLQNRMSSTDRVMPNRISEMSPLLGTITFTRAHPAGNVLVDGMRMFMTGLMSAARSSGDAHNTSPTNAEPKRVE